MHGSAIYPAQIRQADQEVRHCEFVKLKLYTHFLYSMGKIPWKTYQEIPKKYLYNMDEVATNTYDHRWKVLGMVSDMGRVFQITPGGDGRMPFHITLALTSCASGIYSIPIDGIDGAPPPMIIHACKSSQYKSEVHATQSTTDTFYHKSSHSEGLGEPYFVADKDIYAKNNP